MTERLVNPCRNCCESFNGERYSWLPKCEHCKERIDYEKYLKTAEEEGRLVVLPCKAGTRVYEIYQFCGCGAWEIEEHKIKLEDLDKIGKTVFLTREEAEKALKDKMDFHI